MRFVLRFPGVTFGALLFTALTTVAPAQSGGRHRTITGDVRVMSNFHSNLLGNDRDVAVYLPPGYEKDSARHYPVLYMADGQNLFNLETSFLPDQEWRMDESAESLIEARLIEPIIIVAVSNAGAARGDEYLPTRAHIPGAGGKPGPEIGGRADLYGRMLIEELKPLIDRTYRTKTGPADTGLGGSSLGGFVSLYLGLKHPDVFGKLALMSPSVWWNGKELLKFVDQVSKKPRLKIWLDIGTKESESAEADAVEFRDHLTANDWRLGHDLTFYRDYDAHHNERAWSTRIPMVLTYLFPAH